MAKLIGPPSIEWTSTMPANVFMLFRVAAAASGTAGIVKCEVTTPETGAVMRLAVYADDGGSPSALLGESGEIVLVAGWNETSIQSFSVVATQNYWLAFVGGVGRPNLRQLPVNSGMTRKYKSASYGTFSFPDPAGSGFATTDGAGAIEIWAAPDGAGRLIGGKSRLIGGPSPLIGGPSPLIG